MLNWTLNANVDGRLDCMSLFECKLFNLWLTIAIQQILVVMPWLSHDTEY